MAARKERELARTGEAARDSIMLVAIERGAADETEWSAMVAKGTTDQVPLAVIVAEDTEYAKKLKTKTDKVLEATFEERKLPIGYRTLIKVYTCRTIEQAQELIQLNPTIGFAIVHQDVAIRFADSIRTYEENETVHLTQRLVIIGVFRGNYNPAQTHKLNSVISSYRQLPAALNALKGAINTRLRFAINTAVDIQRAIMGTQNPRIQGWIDQHPTTTATTTAATTTTTTTTTAGAVAQAPDLQAQATAGIAVAAAPEGHPQGQAKIGDGAGSSSGVSGFADLIEQQGSGATSSADVPPISARSEPSAGGKPEGTGTRPTTR